jgi:hypothetical protein
MTNPKVIWSRSVTGPLAFNYETGVASVLGTPVDEGLVDDVLEAVVALFPRHGWRK